MSQFTQVEVAGHSMEIIAAHRQYNPNPTPVVFHATFAVPLSMEDLVATLWVVCPCTAELAELGSDAEIRALLMDAIANGDAAAIEEAQCEIADVRPRTVDARHLAQVRAVVARVFTPAAVTAPAPRRLVRA